MPPQFQYFFHLETALPNQGKKKENKETEALLTRTESEILAIAFRQRHVPLYYIIFSSTLTL